MPSSVNRVNRARGWSLAAVLCGAGYVLLSVLAANADRSWSLDRWILSGSLDVRRGWLSPVMVFITIAGASPLGAALILGAGAWSYRWHTWRPAVMCLLAAGSAVVLATVTKLVVDRPRPPMQFWITQENDAGFPSRHSAMVIALGLVLSYVVVGRVVSRWARRTVWVMALVVAALVCLSRVYLAVHWATDVVGGILLGGCIGATVIALDDLLQARRRTPVVTDRG